MPYFYGWCLSCDGLDYLGSIFKDCVHACIGSMASSGDSHHHQQDFDYGCLIADQGETCAYLLLSQISITRFGSS